jgi:hypothetical protein
MSQIRELAMKVWALILSLFGCSVQQEAPKTPQTGKNIEFFYFGIEDGNIEAVKDHVTAIHIPSWPLQYDQAHYLLAAKNAGLKVILTPKAQTETDLVNDLTYWTSLGLTDHIIALYFDEPDLNKTIDPQIVRHALLLFPSLANSRLATSYSTAQNTPGIEHYDWVAVSAYAEGENALTGQYAILRAKLSSDQKLMLLVYGSDPWRVHPKPFLDYAMSDDKVAAIIGFTFFSHDGSDFGAGIGVNGLLPEFRAMGFR